MVPRYYSETCTVNHQRTKSQRRIYIFKYFILEFAVTPVINENDQLIKLEHKFLLLPVPSKGKKKRES